MVRAQVNDGTLKPGGLAPSGAALARMTGFSPFTCRKAIRLLIQSGTLVPGPSPAARPRVAPSNTEAAGHRAEAAWKLSAALAARRHAAGYSQAEVAAITGYSLTTVGHAETGRTWQSRQFWERTDTALRAGGELLSLYDTAHAASAEDAAEPEPDPVCVLIIWRDGTAQAVPRHLAELVASEMRADLSHRHPVRTGT